jgi:predicted NAD/FAD-dependent oxidoreductase
MAVAIIGAGMAGLACAERLVAAGVSVRLFDKGRGPGGRMSTRRVATAAGEAGFDHGAQYFTVRDPAFQARVEQWQRDGLAARWPAAGPDAWVGTPTMNAPVKRMASALDVRWSALVDRVTREDGGWRPRGEGIAEQAFETVLIAVPAEQAGPLLKPWDASMAARAVATPSLPCWTVMAAFAERLPVEDDILRERGIIGWAARNSAKPGRSGPESWVIQAGPDWSLAHLEETPTEVLPALLAALSDRIGAAVPEPLTASAHRWRFARSGSAGVDTLWNADLRLGACGDWLLGPRVESAWVTGDRLAGLVLPR